jgi:tRNA (cmo5U34)-methyltransferase
MQRLDMVWKSAEVVQDFLAGMRGAIPLAAEQLDVMLRLIKAAQPNLENFLDLGCGDGVLGHAILSHYQEARGVFTDFSEPMIEAACSRLEGYGKQVFIVQDYGDSHWIDAILAYAPFDAVVSGFSIHHQPDDRKRELYAEIYRLLKPGGVFVNIEHVSSPSTWIEGLGDELFIDTTLEFNHRHGGSKSRDEVADEFHNRPHKEANILASLELQCDWMREIGFRHVDCYLKIFELAVFGGIRD